jgi:hypothetical protein
MGALAPGRIPDEHAARVGAREGSFEKEAGAKPWTDEAPSTALRIQTRISLYERSHSALEATQGQNDIFFS